MQFCQVRQLEQRRCPVAGVCAEQIVQHRLGGQDENDQGLAKPMQAHLIPVGQRLLEPAEVQFFQGPADAERLLERVPISGRVVQNVDARPYSLPYRPEPFDVLIYYSRFIERLSIRSIVSCLYNFDRLPAFHGRERRFTPVSFGVRVAPPV